MATSSTEDIHTIQSDTGYVQCTIITVLLLIVGVGVALGVALGVAGPSLIRFTRAPRLNQAVGNTVTRISYNLDTSPEPGEGGGEYN